MDQIVHKVLRFDRFALDLTRGCLRMGDQDIDLRPKAFDVLRHLAENAGRLVPKQELYEAVWPNVIVTDDSLVKCIVELRDKLGDDDHSLIKTVSRRGYMLDATVSSPTQEALGTVVQPPAAPPDVASRGVPRGFLRTIQAQSWGMKGVAALGFLLVAATALYLLGPSVNLGEMAPEAVETHYRSFKDCGTCPEMVELPAGEFVMGSPESEAEREGREGPQRRVVLSERVAMAKFEVTIEQFGAFVAETGFAVADQCRGFVLDGRPSEWPLAKGSFQDPGFRASGAHPAVCVSWHDAKAYVAWLSRKTERPYRLPTEAEWEYAARAGTTTAYSFGSDPTKLCEFARFADADSRFPWRSGCHTTVFEPGALRVGTLRPNPWGLFDTLGNAWEWVEDCWITDARLLPSDASAYRPPEGCDSHAIRGGSWGAGRKHLRSAARRQMGSDERYYHIGFRPALSLGR